MRIGAIEAGGTKFLCGVGNELGIMEDVVHFPTEHPDVTLSRVISYFSEKMWMRSASAHSARSI